MDKDVVTEVFLVFRHYFMPVVWLQMRQFSKLYLEKQKHYVRREWNANSRRLRLLAMFHSLRSLFATTISTEPVILFLNLGVGIVYGSGLPTYLQYEKVCRFTLGYDEETCDNLGEEENEDASVEVNEFINRFNLVGTLVRTVLSAVVNLFIGGFVDKYGMKAAIYLAFVGGYAKSSQNELSSSYLDTIIHAIITDHQHCSLFLERRTELPQPDLPC